MNNIDNLLCNCCEAKCQDYYIYYDLTVLWTVYKLGMDDRYAIIVKQKYQNYYVYIENCLQVSTDASKHCKTCHDKF